MTHTQPFSKQDQHFLDDEGITVGLRFAARLFKADQTTQLKAIHKARAMYRDSFGKEARLFSFSDGLYDLALARLLKEQGFEYGFTHTPSVVFRDLNAFAVPRFFNSDMNFSLPRFRNIVRALPLPVSDETPETVHMSTPQLIAGMSFQSTTEQALKCSLSESTSLSFETIGQRLEIRGTLLGDKASLICTTPTQDDTVFRWYGRDFYFSP